VKEIIFPHFLHCCQETEDLYWKYIFEDLSYGRAPYGVYFTKGFMCCGFKGKEFSYVVDTNKPIPDLYSEVKNILQNKLGIQSSEDIILQRELFDNTSKQISLFECNDWNDIKKKETKNFLLTNFIMNKKKLLPKIKSNKLLATLMLVIQLKIINNDDIIVENGKIIDIENWDNILKSNIKNWNICTKKKSEINNKKIKISTLWKK